jgi:hypothetical protein
MAQDTVPTYGLQQVATLLGVPRITLYNWCVEDNIGSYQHIAGARGPEQIRLTQFDIRRVTALHANTIRRNRTQGA